MSSDIDLNGFKKRLKQSAIDAWMKTEAEYGAVGKSRQQLRG